MDKVYSLLQYEHMFNFRFDFRSEMNRIGSDNDRILPIFDISSRKLEPEVEHVMFEVQLNDYLGV